MKKFLYLFLILLFLSGCSLFRKNEPSPEVNLNSDVNELGTVEEIEKEIGETPFEDDPEVQVVETNLVMSGSFYPLKESLDDLRREMNELKARIVEYETRVSVPNVNTDMLKIIKTPHLKHRITLSNGTIVHGNILKEDSEKMTVETQLGQITLDKTTIEEYTEVSAPAPEVKMDGTFSGPERRDEGQKFIYSGKLVNNGKHKADFVRIIFKIWDENTKLIASDSAFVDGSKIKYSNGVITDSALNPGDIGTFTISVDVPKGSKYEYETYDIYWENFK
ncbi:MAG: hypothetical protein CMF96_09320 [Candidatus Marinimicrobia bacterium]|nr:hypothetical protein [Candidatus Neomarinimicrobiota bacterium]|tara:strand:- start:977 stop:1810 length:834 start_codon:yes stop_codon:yes gene_type:complete